MASVPPTPTPTSSSSLQIPLSNSPNSTTPQSNTNPAPHQPIKQEEAEAKEPLNVYERKPEIGGGSQKKPEIKTEVKDIKDEVEKSLEELEAERRREKLDKYYSDFNSYILAKYFSGKNIYGGNIFEKETVIDGQTIKSSRFPPTKSFADPVKFFEDMKSSTSSMEVPTTSNASSKKSQGKKSTA